MAQLPNPGPASGKWEIHSEVSAAGFGVVCTENVPNLYERNTQAQGPKPAEPPQPVAGKKSL